VPLGFKEWGVRFHAIELGRYSGAALEGVVGAPMRNERVKACLNLHAVLPNLEEVVAFDPQVAELTRTWDVTVEFRVRHGPQAHVAIHEGRCRVRPGPADKPHVRLWFTSPRHLNAMFEGRAKPIPTKGFSRLGFLSGEFPKLTDRMERYLRASEETLKDRRTFELVTRCLLFTAVFGLKELAENDPAVAELAAQTPNGTTEFRILPDGPAVHLTHANGSFSVGKGPAPSPNARMAFRDYDVCHRLLNGRMDTFAAVGRGDVVITGFLPLVDRLSSLLEYLERYLK